MTNREPPVKSGPCRACGIGLVRYTPSADTRDFLATWGPAVDRRISDVVRAAQRLLGAGYCVEWDNRNARCSGAVRELHCALCVDGVDDCVDAAFREAWDHCTARWDRAVSRRRARARARAAEGNTLTMTTE